VKADWHFRSKHPVPNGPQAELHICSQKSRPAFGGISTLQQRYAIAIATGRNGRNINRAGP